ncbi:unnamed protein product [Linum tenue]|uniref:Uncharacterized protein n=1 Tax=Linum tenue TaxID=586396 RepID=A0AAV0L892_9ROSI|nr:unnamed protein product [Linum tenue]
MRCCKLLLWQTIDGATCHVAGMVIIFNNAGSSPRIRRRPGFSLALRSWV